MKSFDDTDFRGRLTGSPRYTASDLRKFEQLEVFPAGAGRGSPEDRVRHETKPHGPQQPQRLTQDVLRYCPADELEFQALAMPTRGPTAARRSAAGAQFGNPGTTGYTEHDVRMFEQLGSFDSARSNYAQDGARDLAGECSPAVPIASDYSQQDRELFARLAPGERAQERYTDAEGDEHAAGTRAEDANIKGYIKIVDFDHENERRRNGRGRTPTAMKIRFFD